MVDEPVKTFADVWSALEETAEDANRAGLPVHAESGDSPPD